MREVALELLTHLLVVAVAIGGAWWLFLPGMPLGHDLTMHLYRMQALDQHLSEGVLFPRWFDNFVFGHGYPLLHFYAPLFYYLAVGFRWLGLDYVTAFKAVCLLSRLVGGLGAYHFARARLGSQLAGLIAGVAFLVVSYQYTDLWVRVAAPELLALNLLPLGFLVVDRLAAQPSPGRVAAAATVLALLVLAHQTTALTSAGALGSYAIYRLVQCQHSTRQLRQTTLVAVRLGAAGLLAVGLAAFYWLPAMADRHTVPLELLPPGFPPFVEQLLDPDELVQSSLVYEREYPDFLRLGLIETLFLLTGLLAVPGALRRNRSTLVFFALLGIVFALAMTTLSRPFWEALPFATLMQFPFRLQMYVSLATAVLIGGLACLKWKWLAWPTSLMAIALLAVSSLGALQPQPVELRPDAITQASFARLELSPQWPLIGTTVPTQFMPRWVSIPAEAIHDVRQPGQAASAEDLDATVTALARRGTELILQTTASRDFTLRYHGFYFPGWQAEIDGQPTTISPDGPKALVSLPVPAGDHRITLSFGRTPLWTAAAAISVVSVGVVALLALTGARQRRRIPIWGALVGSLALTGVTIALPHLVSARSPTIQPAHLEFDAGLTLAGWSARQENRPAGALLELDLYWFARRDVESDYEVTVQIRDARDETVTSYHRPPRWGSMPTSTWSRGEVVRDAHEVPLPENLPDGRYELNVGLRRPNGGDVTSHHLGAVEIRRTPARLPTPPPPGLHPKRVDLANGLTLLGYRADADLAGKPSTLRPRGNVAVTLLWQARDEIPEDCSVAVFLADHRGEKFGLRHSYPPHDLAFTATWRKGDTHVQQFELPIPADLTPGVYWLSLEASDYRSGRLVAIAGGEATEGAARIPLERFKVAPATPAPPQHPIGQRFGDAITLDGYDLSAQRAPLGKITRLEVGLHWRAIASPPEDYTVFVHLYDQSGRLITQHDGPPRDGLYPTSVWDPSEIVLDRHRLTIDPSMPSGSYTLKVGLYQPASGKRLVASSGADSVELGTVTID